MKQLTAKVKWLIKHGEIFYKTFIKKFEVMFRNKIYTFLWTKTNYTFEKNKNWNTN